MSLLGVEEPVMHGPIQPVTLHGLNENHPITQGLGPIETGDDEVFDAVLKPGDSTLLFKSTGSETNRERNGGWAREQGEGRVVALLPGHTQFPYHTEGFKKIMWRSAHWAMNREIGPEGHLEKGY
jgi:trehalose utilization protein